MATIFDKEEILFENSLHAPIKKRLSAVTDSLGIVERENPLLSNM